MTNKKQGYILVKPINNNGGYKMKLTKQDIKEIKDNINKGLTLCLPLNLTNKQYQNIIKQIENKKG